MKTSRRSFLKQLSVATAVPFILPSHIWAADTQPNDVISIGFIGMGMQSRGLMEAFLYNQRSRVVAVCDVDTTRREAALRRAKEFYEGNPDRGNVDCQAYVDYRELIARDDIDAVCVVTPDHWHAIQTIAALESGKDVYCEKPLTHNVRESIAVIEAVERHNRVLQTGSMQRSMREFRVACELVQNGTIGTITHVEARFGSPGVPCDLPEEEMEPGLDWEKWLGPAPVRPYSSVLSPRGIHGHFPDWRNYREFGGGMVTDWGAHHLDIAQWGLNRDNSGPVEIIPPENPEATSGAVLRYDDGITVTHGGPFGIHFYGSEGLVKVDRGRIEFWRNNERIAGFLSREDGGSLGSALDFIENEYLTDAKIKLYQSGDHVRNFLDCVESRERPITDAIVGGRSSICCHLMNQAYYNHSVIKWEPEAMRYADDNSDPAWLTRSYREPWTL